MTTVRWIAAERIDDDEIVEHPVSVILVSIDPTDARNATVRRFGRSDGSSLIPGAGVPRRALC
jgi:hypothetical protein